MRINRNYFGAYAVDDSAGIASETYGPVNPADQTASYTKYVVKSGDDLGKIAAAFLGNPSRWREIWDANPQISNPDVISPGQVLQIPGVRVSTPSSSSPGVMPGPKISAVTTDTSSYIDPFEDLVEIPTITSSTSSAPFYTNPMFILGVGLVGAMVVAMASSRSKVLS